jgi:hypothetical protein
MVCTHLKTYTFILCFIALDFPRLRDEPSYDELLDLLSALEIKPSSWTEQHSAAVEDTAGISRYLTSVLSNPFDWLDEVDPEGEKKELLWDLASKRISERCGRSGTQAHRAMFTVRLY